MALRVVPDEFLEWVPLLAARDRQRNRAMEERRIALHLPTPDAAWPGERRSMSAESARPRLLNRGRLPA